MKNLWLLTLPLLMGADDCDRPSMPRNKAEQEQKAERAADAIHFDENAEIDNISRRLKLTSDPGLLGYIVLFNGAGSPIRYTTVKGKVTSGSKRLTRPWAYRDVWDPDKSDPTSNSHYALVEAPGDEGTYGSSNPYIYFWTQSGQYVQWSGDYLYSDQPIRLSVEPIVVDVL